MLNRLLFGLALMAVGTAGKYVIGGNQTALENASVIERKTADAPYNVKKNVVAYKVGDLSMADARKKAKATFPKFMEYRQAGKPGTYSVKFPLTQNGETEHIWLQVEKIGKSEITGRLANKPVNGDKYKMGQRLSVKVAQVEDWMVRASDGIYGGYTVRAMLKDMPADQAKAIAAMLRD